MKTYSDVSPCNSYQNIAAAQKYWAINAFHISNMSKPSSDKHCAMMPRHCSWQGRNQKEEPFHLRGHFSSNSSTHGTETFRRSSLRLCYICFIKNNEIVYLIAIKMYTNFTHEISSKKILLNYISKWSNYILSRALRCIAKI